MFQLHRDKFYAALGEDVAVLRGALMVTRFKTDRDLQFKQEGMFYYFTGCCEADCCAIFDAKTKSA